MIPHRSPKKILLVGEYSEGGMTWNCLFSLRSLGHEVVPFVTSTRKDSVLPQTLQNFKDYFDNKRINQKLLATVQQTQPDIIFFIKAHTITARTIRALKDISSATLINWYPDNPFVFWNGNSNAQVLNALPFYDLFVIWSHLLIEPLKTAGCKEVMYAPFGYSQQLFEKEVVFAPNDYYHFASEASFIGTWDAERQQWLEALIQRMGHLNLAIWGNGWREATAADSCLRPFIKGRPLFDQELLKVLRLSQISLNFIRQQNKSAHNMRTIEIPAGKGFQLTQRSLEQAELLFKEHETIACFSSVEELVEKITYYLQNPAERDHIITASYAHVQQYELTRVIQKIVDTIEQTATFANQTKNCIVDRSKI